jgi:hypothetical protein
LETGSRTTDLLYLAGGVLFYIVVLVVTLRIYLRIVKKLLFRSDIAGRTTAQRLLNLAITGMLFRGTAFLLFIEPLNFVIRLSDIFREAVIPVVTGLQMPPADTGEIGSRYNLLSSQFDVLRDFASRILAFGNLFFIFLAGAFLLILARAVNKIFYDEQQRAYSLDKLDGGKRRVMTLLTISVAAFYLMFCAVTATAVIEDGQSGKSIALPNIDTAMQRTVSIGAVPTIPDSGLLAELPTLAGSIAMLDSVMRQDTLFRDNGPAKAELESLKGLSNEFATAAQSLKSQIKAYNNDALEFAQEAKNLREAISLRFQRATSLSLSNRAKQNYYDGLITYYQSDIRLRRSMLEAAQSRVENKTADLETQLRRSKAEIERLAIGIGNKEVARLPDLEYLRPSYWSYGDNSNVYYARSIEDIPGPDTSGSDYNWLGVMSNWLSSPHNMDLVLIIGMIGFGLFGASISSIIAKRSREGMLSSISEDIIQVVISGFSAAIIVFLATKGGIAIVNQGTNQPNPYVLFFSCLVGSVFSDRIWEWAKAVINRNYNPESTSRTSITEQKTLVIEEKKGGGATPPKEDDDKSGQSGKKQ